MPYSFTEIEKQKRWVINAVFIFLVIFYFLVAWLLWIITKSFLPFIPVFTALKFAKNFFTFSLKEAGVVFFMAFITASIHWYFSTSDMVTRILGLLGAEDPDPKDSYHQVFKNIVEEVCVATGRINLRSCIIPTAAVNAFALSGLDGDKVIGITEGLLARLNRSQLEAVIAHEAAHIACEDSLPKTITCSLFGIYSALLDGISQTISSGSDTESIKEGRTGIVIIYLGIIYIILSITQFINFLLNMFLSRQTECRADAVAVRLSRNPIALAEALYIISRSWRGVGGVSGALSPIFIMNPDYSNLEEQEGLIADLFSTHPPIRNRLAILLDMAHSDLVALKESIHPKPKISVKEGIAALNEESLGQWQLYKDGSWQGPFGLEELFNQGLNPNSWVEKFGSDLINPALDDPDLCQALREKLTGKRIEEDSLCPKCRQPLCQALYEGAPILQCHYCNGILASNDVISRIVSREDFSFGSAISEKAEEFWKLLSKGMLRDNFKVVYEFNCPKCKNKMERQAFTLGYPIVVDRCEQCRYVWFDQDELEILQYLIEKFRRENNSVL